jgi:TIR domain
MRVFISWSGEPSRLIAKALDGWLESVVQHVDAWMSDEEIGSGQRWNEAIAHSLDETDLGIVCVTRANQHAPWLIFEAGAVAKSVKKGRVVPLYIDLLSTDITGPLEAFQGRSLDENGVRRLVHDLNEAAEKKMPKERLDAVFNAMWPELEAAIDEALKGMPTPDEPQRDVNDMVAEIVERVRRIERTTDMAFPLAVFGGRAPTRQWDDLLDLTSLLEPEQAEKAGRWLRPRLLWVLRQRDQLEEPPKQQPEEASGDEEVPPSQ